MTTIASGATGPQGLPGIDGKTVVAGVAGTQGPIGLTGATGAEGIPGVAGTAGASPFSLVDADAVYTAGSVGIGVNPPDASAVLDISSTSKGLLAPRMTTAQRTAITTPATGLALYDTDIKDIMIYNGTAWVSAGSSSGSLKAASNLSDLADKATARTNLGISTAGNTGSYSDLTNTPTLGALAAKDTVANADIAVAAAIADTKLATISTAGKVSNSATTATSANTVNTIVARDASGNFSAGTITATLAGNAASTTIPGSVISGNISGNAVNVTGTVAVANGGTGATTLTANNVLLGNGTSAPQAVAPGTSGNVLTSNGSTWTSSAPSRFTHYVGEPFQGGIVAAVWKVGSAEHWLIASVVDVSTSSVWSNATPALIGGSAIAGQANTTANLGQTGHSASAAKVCDDYTNTNIGTGAYSDW